MGNKGLDYTALVDCSYRRRKLGTYRIVPTGSGSADIRPDELDFQNHLCGLWVSAGIYLLTFFGRVGNGRDE